MTTAAKGDKPHLLWEGGWEGHEQAQLLRMAGLSFEEKLRWLQEAQELIQAFEKNRILNPPSKTVMP
jgi:hypothetical protein